MEEAIDELRNAIHLASNSEPDRNHERNDELLNNDVQGSENTNISSLSGSLPSTTDRSNALASRRKNYHDYAANTMPLGGEHHEDSDSRHAWRRRRLHAAKRVENAVSNYEVAIHTFHNEAASSVNWPEPSANEEGTKNEHADDIVDLLVAVMTSVPRNLLQQQLDSGEVKVHDSEQEDDRYTSMETVCYNAACITSDVIRKYFLSPTLEMAHPPFLEDRHVYELVDEVANICSSESSMNIDPIVRVLNFLAEECQIERAMYEREQGNDVTVDGHQTLFSFLQPKDSLRMIHTLMYRYLCDQEDECAEASDLVGHFIGYLLEHFCNGVVMDMGAPGDCTGGGLFDGWADGLDEHRVQRLNDDEARDVRDLIFRYHVGSIQIALQLIENTELVVSNAIAESEKIDSIDGNILQNVLIALQGTIRQMTIVVVTTEVMDKLNFEHDSEIHTIFQPLIVSYARFIASTFHDAIDFVRSTCASTLEGEELSILADDLLFRLCHVNIVRDFFQHSHADTGEEEEVIAISLLRAMNSQCIAGKARFLIGIAVDRVRCTDKGNLMLDDDEPSSKRQRALLGPSFGSGQLSPRSAMHKAEKSSPSGEKREEMMDILLACLNLSRSNQNDDNPDGMSAKQASCITSALMSCREEASAAGKNNSVLDVTNPWHSLQVKPLLKLADLEASDNGTSDEDTPHSLISYAHLTPHCFDTKSP